MDGMAELRYEYDRGYFILTESTCRICGQIFSSKKNLAVHWAAIHYSLLAVPLHKVRCDVDGCNYAPAPRVRNPRSCLRNHQRKVHKMWAKPYVIREEP